MRRTRRRLRLPTSFFVSAALLAGCGDGPNPNAVVRDSAGITILENSVPAWGQGEGWTVSAEPSLEIGVLEGDTSYTFREIRHVARMPDGAIAVGDFATVRVYDADGRIRFSGGGMGEAPGQLGNTIFRISPYRGDSIAVLEHGSRVTLFDGDGRFGRSVRLIGYGDRPADDGWVARLTPGVHTALPDGRWVATGWGSWPITEAGVHWGRTPVFLFDPDGGSPTALDTLPAWEQAITLQNGRLYPRNTVHGNLALVTYGPTTYHVLRTDRYEIVTRDYEGRLRRLVRLDRTPRPVTEQDRSEYTENYIAWLERVSSEFSPQTEERVRSSYRDVPLPATIPLAGEMLLDATGSLWVGDYAGMPGRTGVTEWTVFDADGRLLGRVETPPDLQVTEIGEDHVLGIYTDEHDVNYVRLYRLAR